MKKVGRIVSLLSAAAMMLSSAGLTAFAQQESGSKENTVSSAVAAMSTEQKLEQMMMISLRKWTDKDEKAREMWDELEKSVVTHVADDVKVAIRGRTVEMAIYKKLNG